MSIDDHLRRLAEAPFDHGPEPAPEGRIPRKQQCAEPATAAELAADEAALVREADDLRKAHSRDRVREVAEGAIRNMAASVAEPPLKVALGASEAACGPAKLRLPPIRLDHKHATGGPLTYASEGVGSAPYG